MPTASSLAWKTSPKSQDAVALQIKERGALPMIDRGDIRQAIDRCSNIWASLPGAGYGQFGAYKLTAWLQNSKKRAWMVREIDVWAESPRLSPAWLSASSSACHGLLIITVINAITYKAQRDKNARELKLANAAITGYADASAWCCRAWCKIHEGVSWC